jgi:hypothetical protein
VPLASHLTLSFHGGLVLLISLVHSSSDSSSLSPFTSSVQLHFDILVKYSIRICCPFDNITATMRFSTFSAIATFVAAALAQDLSQLPSCGVRAITRAERE